MRVVRFVLGRSSVMVGGGFWLLMIIKFLIIIIMVRGLVWSCRDARPVFPPVVELRLFTGQDVSTGLDHVCGESKLLAVEDEEISLLIVCVLT